MAKRRAHSPWGELDEVGEITPVDAARMGIGLAVVAAAGFLMWWVFG